MTEPLSPNKRILCLAASGLRALESHTKTSEVYPLALQMALSRFVLLGLKRGIATPQHVPELLEWCRQPISTWGLQLPNLAGPDEPLLYGAAFTELAETFARAGDAEALLEEAESGISDLCNTFLANLHPCPQAVMVLKR